MEVTFTLWSLKAILDKIPFDTPVDNVSELDFSELAVPYYVKYDFKVSILYEDSLPYEASCAIYSPKHKVTVVIILKKQYEYSLKAWLAGNAQVRTQCCRRRELYCHETCHLIAIIRAFPSDRYARVREDFIAKIKEKFAKSIASAEGLKAVPFISVEQADTSPSAFDKEHFRYSNDSLNYFRLYQELMLVHSKMTSAVKKLCNLDRQITFDDVAQETLVSYEFFQLFPEKLTELKELLLEEMSKQASE